MERITNKDLKKAADRKSMTESRRAVSGIGKDDKIDTSKMKVRPSDNDKKLAEAYRFRMGLPKTMSDAEVLKMYRQRGITNQMRQKEKDFSNPRLSDQDVKTPKKSIMELPTNVPRLMKGANLMNPDKADLNKDGKLSGYEKARGKAIEKNMNIKKAK